MCSPSRINSEADFLRSAIRTRGNCKMSPDRARFDSHMPMEGVTYMLLSPNSARDCPKENNARTVSQ
jgi:hypothetical protein